jgi:membrane-associated protease RseP (regulator of RpoE activity)
MLWAMTTTPDNDKDTRRIENLSKLLADLCEIETWYRHGDRVTMTLAPHWSESTVTAAWVRDRLKTSGYRFTLTESAERLTLSVDPRPRLRIPLVNIVLFIVTVATVYLFPVFMQNVSAVAYRMDQQGIAPPQSFGEYFSLVSDAMPLAWHDTRIDLSRGVGLLFTLAMISILLIHEMGHFVVSRRRGLAATWPYFIPGPTIIGTFGAVIKSKSPIWNRRDLVELGAAGPIAGWVVAVAWLVYGLMHATPANPDDAPIKAMGFFMQGESLLVRFLTPLLAGEVPQGFIYIFPEAAVAGWAGLLLTAMNLLPIGQLDGGHVVYGLLPDMQKKLGWIAVTGLLLLGMQSSMWWLFAFMGLAFGVGHPPTMQDHLPINRRTTIIGAAAIAILILSFTPVPFR